MSDDGDVNSQVDALVTGLVREFLYRRGLTSILRTFDEETSYSPGEAVTSTRELVEALRLSTLYKRNAVSGAYEGWVFSYACYLILLHCELR